MASFHSMLHAAPAVSHYAPTSTYPKTFPSHIDVPRSAQPAPRDLEPADKADELDHEETQKFIDNLTYVLERVCSINNQVLGVGDFASVNGYYSKSSRDGSANNFYSFGRPNFAIRDYVARIVYANHHYGISKAVYMVALIYMTRVHQSDESLAVNSLNVHRLFVTAVTLASKWLEDVPTWNKVMAYYGGMHVTHLNDLETEMLKRLHYDLRVQLKDYYFMEQWFEQQCKKPMDAGQFPTGIGIVPRQVEEEYEEEEEYTDDEEEEIQEEEEYDDDDDDDRTLPDIDNADDDDIRPRVVGSGDVDMHDELMCGATVTGGESEDSECYGTPEAVRHGGRLIVEKFQERVQLQFHADRRY